MLGFEVQRKCGLSRAKVWGSRPAGSSAGPAALIDGCATIDFPGLGHDYENVMHSSGVCIDNLLRIDEM